MAHRILITGGSGYLGGSLLARWPSSADSNFPAYDKVYALVRTDEQANAIKQNYRSKSIEPIQFNPKSEDAVREAIVSHRITIVYFLIDALSGEMQGHFIKALAEVKKQTGLEVHFLHTTGAKIFSSHAGAPTDRPLLDTDPNLYDIQKAQKPIVPILRPAIDANNTVIEQGERYGVRTYIFTPCIVYGKGEGFGNKLSIQTVAIIKAGISARRVYSVDEGRPTWPVCHIEDNTALYLDLLRAILTGRDDNTLPGSGKHGYYLAASGSVAWMDVYAAIATSLAKRGLVDDVAVERADDEALEKMGAAIGHPKDLVPLSVGGLCTFTAKHGEQIGWKPRYPPHHILEAADDEVELVLSNQK
ncbi:hypothetical protein HRR83_005287 [Exophiala dermatitidis]|uniref:NAD-dependent epimerase/dehydratase domain-containing protein n=2 Tax=Exophiala dermatitidis TaxID=5970 RepID=H6C1S2_EXODN|nr:uncharacterized protein HMPREF1120_05825 [Exophiala dermatitidis NIH/UT8656]KAJ4515982.1 hypothetical protein HRR74_005139 [Exophiala dermatitidis]EHY57801.1 hypothetical protein HMPREF1120_05825 [Exophiala dermatitidis NIH/UT8656]KAJ4518612.1 hypothetical protein HRR73_004193 [Exophiala dermatitidis]KAJ4534122.1 hypothetical protein HRR76_006059 [Exophiala dermatitidis]KAJ4550274.1 hypothetical protein HRR77_003745 [Exophiala dermatitidis]